MKLTLKKIFMISVLSSFSSLTFANDIPITLLSNSHGNNFLHINKIVDIVKHNVSLTNNSQYSQAKVQMIYDNNKKPDHLLVYLLSATKYSLSITKINITENYKVISVTPQYHLQKQDLEQQPHVVKLNELTCPDNSVEFIAATPVDDYPTAKAAIDYVYHQAANNHYAAHQLLGNDASVTNYENWLACPNLKGFFNIGHGDPEGILLADGFLSYDIFNVLLKKKLQERAVVLFNSCEVANDPLKSAVVENADAQKYGGGITTLYIGPSEEASKCFWDATFNRQPMTASLMDCNNKFDPDDVFGMSGHGLEFINLPKS